MNEATLVAVIQGVEDRRTGRKRYTIEWRRLLLSPGRRFFMMALRRRWTNEEIRILFKYQDDLKTAARILGRSYGAVRTKWVEVRRKLGIGRKTRVKCVAFPEPDISLRIEVIEKLLPRTLEIHDLLSNRYKEMLHDEKLSVRELVWMGRVVLGLFGFIERCLTGKELLEIYKDEKNRADQSEEGSGA